jgi:hypothetical protein
MATAFKTFREEIERDLDKRKMGLPHPSAEPLFKADNHDYERVRASWRQAKRALEFENSLLKRLEGAPDLEEELSKISDEDYEDDCPPLCGFDIAVVAVVLTFAAMGCHPYASCNGGCSGDFHHEKYPLVVFFAKAADAGILLKAAEGSGVGIGHTDMGLVVWANDIWDMHHFAEALMKSHEAQRIRRRRG